MPGDRECSRVRVAWPRRLDLLPDLYLSERSVIPLDRKRNQVFKVLPQRMGGHGRERLDTQFRITPRLGQ